MKNLKKVLAILLALAMTAGALSGCISNYVNTETTPAPTQQQTQAPPQTPAETAKPGETAAPETEPDISGITLDVWYAVSGTSGEEFTKQSEAFAKQYGVTLNLSYSGGSGDTATKVAAAQLTDTAPDVALMYAGPLYTGGKDNYDIDNLIKTGKGFDIADVFEGMMDYCVYMGEGYCALPYGISTQVLYYNKTMLKDAGVDMTNPPKTWKEFKEVLLKVKASAGENKAFDTTDQAWLFKSMLMQNGCTIINNENGEITPIFNNAQAVEVADYWYSLVTDGLMPAGEHNNAENTFLSGNLAFLAASSNRISRWVGTTSFELGAIEMPYFTQPSLALGGNVLVILTRDPAKLQAAWMYLCYLTNVENNTAFALATGYLPIHKSALEQANVKKAIEENELYSVAFKQLSYTWAYTHFEQMGTMDTEIKAMLNKLEKGRGTSQDLLDKAVQTLQKEIDADK